MLVDSVPEMKRAVLSLRHLTNDEHGDFIQELKKKGEPVPPLLKQVLNSNDLLIATRDVVLPTARGAAALYVLAPKGIKVSFAEGQGSSVVYHSDISLDVRGKKDYGQTFAQQMLMMGAPAETREALRSLRPLSIRERWKFTREIAARDHVSVATVKDEFKYSSLLIATRDTVLPNGVGSSRLDVVVPQGLTVSFDKPEGHSTLYPSRLKPKKAAMERLKAFLGKFNR